MPRGNGMGPMGAGPTGRGLGPCCGVYDVRNSMGYGYGMGLGFRHGQRGGFRTGYADAPVVAKTREELLSQQKAFLAKRIEYIDSLLEQPE